MKRFLICILFLVVLLNGCAAEKAPEIKIIPETTELNAPMDMDQSIYFNVGVLNGLSAMSLGRLLYEQPVIYEHVAFEYLVYMERRVFDDAILKEGFDFLCLPFDMGLDLLIKNKEYVLYAIMESDVDEEKNIELALLVKQTTLNIYPEVVVSFFNTYYKASIWANDHGERMMFYLEQLEIESDIKTLTYRRAWVSEELIKSKLTLNGKTDDEINIILKSVFRP